MGIAVVVFGLLVGVIYWQSSSLKSKEAKVAQLEQSVAILNQQLASKEQNIKEIKDHQERIQKTSNSLAPLKEKIKYIEVKQGELYDKNTTCVYNDITQFFNSGVYLPTCKENKLLLPKTDKASN